jgi:hypothetical protein
MIVAKWILVVVALYNFGGLVADGIVPSTARQHLWNPAWPPHAKFHNGQTMLMGVILGALALVLLFAFRTTPSSLLLAAAFASVYFIAMALAPLLPGTAWSDPEFRDGVKLRFGLAPQQLLSYALCGLVAVAVALVAYSGTDRP